MITPQKSKTKAVVLMSLLLLSGIIIGFFVGIILSSIIAKKKENPVFWKQEVMKRLEKLHPNDEQRKKFSVRTDSAVQELVSIRKEAINDVWEVVQRAVVDIDKDLTPEQRVTFDKIKPKDKPGEAQ